MTGRHPDEYLLKLGVLGEPWKKNNSPTFSIEINGCLIGIESNPIMVHYKSPFDCVALDIQISASRYLLARCLEA